MRFKTHPALAAAILLFGVPGQLLFAQVAGSRTFNPPETSETQQSDPAKPVDRSYAGPMRSRAPDAEAIGRPFEPVQPEFAPLPAGAVARRFVATAGASGHVPVEVSGDQTLDDASAQLVYSNTEGQTRIRILDSGGRMSDDIVTTVISGCPLDQYVVRVIGNFTNDPAEERSFNVSVGLFDRCPGAPPFSEPPEPITGTECAFNNLPPGTLPGEPGNPDSPLELICQIPPDSTVPLPNSFYVGIQFNRGNAGVVAGALPIVGFSADRFDFPGASCTAGLGSRGFPTNPHASFFTQVYVRGECRETFLTYRNSNHGGPAFSPGGSVFFADTLNLSESEGCNLIGYEFAAKGAFAFVSGLVTAELRTELTSDFGNDGRCADGSLCNVGTWRRCRSTGECIAGVCVGGFDAGSPCCKDGPACLHRLTLRGSESRLFVFGTSPQVQRVLFRRCVGGPNDGVRCTDDARCGEGGSCTAIAPIPFDKDEIHMVFTTSISQVGPLWTKFPASWGSTPDHIRVFRNLRWEEEVLSPADHSALDITLFCDGSPPVGACCDMVVTADRTCLDGPFDGEACNFGDDCACPPDSGDCFNGRCIGDSVCREVPKINCASVAIRPDLWAEGGQCESVCVGGPNAGAACTRQADCPGGTCPGPFSQPCGVSVCCTPDDTCENLTEAECRRLVGPEISIVWRRGKLCEDPDQSCPFFACVRRQGDCAVSRAGTGCRNPFCCQAVCEVDPICCQSSWDGECVRLYNQFFGERCFFPPMNDSCFSMFPGEGALLLERNTTTVISNLGAGEDPDDPGFSCHAEDPGTPGFGTVWFRFVPTHRSARIHTCGTEFPLADSIVEIYRARDNSSLETACQSLESIGCSDDEPKCSGGLGADRCVRDLTPGETYYVQLAARTPEARGIYHVRYESPCRGRSHRVQPGGP